MEHEKDYEVVIVGGSYAGLSAALALGRSLRKVLVVDSGLPCNRHTPHSHNFITHDGAAPAEIAGAAKQQLLKYDTVSFYNDLVTGARIIKDGFDIITRSGKEVNTKKIIFASGIRDILPKIEGIEDCWGITAVHCPYCHGYEIKHQNTAIMANGDMAFEMAKMVSNWTRQLTVLTNGKSGLAHEQSQLLQQRGITIDEREIYKVVHKKGYIESVIFNDGSSTALNALYLRPPFQQHCLVPEQLGCELNEQGLIKVDMFQKTNVPGVYACGDNCSPMRALSNAVYTGSFAGAAVNRQLTEEGFDLE